VSAPVPAQASLREILQAVRVRALRRIQPPSTPSHMRNRQSISSSQKLLVSSPFTVDRSPFTVHRSPFTVHRRPFTVDRSPWQR
jgi:hypothetical protein